MSKIYGELEASIQAKIEADNDFQSSLDGLSDDEKTSILEQKKSELLDEELTHLREKATKAEKAEEVANNYKIRAEKAEKEAKNKYEPQKSSEISLTPKDLLMLNKSNIEAEDLDEVVDFAKYRKITVAEALQNQTLKRILADRVEERRTAAATQTKGGRAPVKTTDTAILQRAQQGVLPENEEDIDRLAEARLKSRMKR